MRPGRLLLGLFLLSWYASPDARARQAASLPDTSRSQPIVTRVHFNGNTFFSDDVLALRVRAKPNRRFLNIPGVTPWLWIHRLGASGALGGRIGQALMAGGEPPAYLDSTVVTADVERLEMFYRQEGFREARVTARVDTAAGGRHARVAFEIEPGTPTYLRHITYDGLEQLDPEQQWRLTRGSLLRTERASREAPLLLEGRSQRYSEPTLLEERRRMLGFLRNAGFAVITRDSIRAIVIPERPDSFDVIFRIRPGPRYRFGDVHFEVTGLEAGTPLRADTLLRVPPADGAAGGQVTARIQEERALDPGLLLRALQLRPGDWYDQSRLLATKRRLEATGVFAFTDILPLEPDTLAGPGAPRLPHRMELRTRRRHQVRLETFMFQRSGVFVDPELATGLGLSYQNVNLLGGGETFQVRGTGSVAADIASNIEPAAHDTAAAEARATLFTSAQAEIATSLTYPYLVAPFRRLDQRLNLYDARTRLSFSLLTARRDELLLVIRGRGQARARLEMQHTPTVTSLVDLFDLSLSNPDTLKGFKVNFLDKIIGTEDSLIITDPVQREQIMEDYTQPQVNSILRYTLHSARVNPLLRDRGYSYEGSVSVGNNLLYLLDRFVFTPDTLEGSLPGLPLFSGGRTGNRLIYRQYVRLTVDLRQYRPLGRGTVLAAKFVGGVAQPIGRANLVPFDRRFYSGGATSVRGWELRALGPGTTEPGANTPAADVPNILGGDIKLETSLELRSTLLRNLFAARWMSALFVDAGNVWFGPRNPGDPEGRFRLGAFYREIGVGSGFGLRVVWEYLILRFDLGYQMLDPARRAEGLFPEGFNGPFPRRPRLHFGIGHAF